MPELLLSVTIAWVWQLTTKMLVSGSILESRSLNFMFMTLKQSYLHWPQGRSPCCIRRPNAEKAVMQVVYGFVSFIQERPSLYFGWAYSCVHSRAVLMAAGWSSYFVCQLSSIDLQT